MATLDGGRGQQLLIPVPEAHAQWLGIGRSKFYELVAAGDIEVVKVGSRTLVPTASLERFVERLRRDPAPAA